MTPSQSGDLNKLLHAHLQNTDSAFTAHGRISNALGGWLPVLGPVIEEAHTQLSPCTTTSRSPQSDAGKRRAELQCHCHGSYHGSKEGNHDVKSDVTTATVASAPHTVASS